MLLQFLCKYRSLYLSILCLFPKSFFRMEIVRLERMIELKSKEMNRVKKLAKNILDQVCLIFPFFLLKLSVFLSQKK